MGARQLAEEAGDPDRPLRLFFGLPLPEEHRRALAGYLAACERTAPEFRWTPAGNLHLTIRFLGHVAPSLAQGIAERVEAGGIAAFDLGLGDLGTFKRGRLARVVWLGLASGAAEAAALAAVVETESVRAGLEPENRRFSGHLTLARARPRDGAQLPALSQPPRLPSWRASELILYRSRLGRAGSVYEPVRTIPLR